MRTIPSSGLAALVRANRDLIAFRWIAAVQALRQESSSGSPGDYLSAVLERGVDAFAEYLDTGSSESMDPFLADVASMRMRRDFEIGMIIESLMLLREAVLSVLLDARDPLHPDVATSVSGIEAATRGMLGRFGQIHSADMHLESESLQRVASALLEMHELGDVLGIVCAEARRLTGAEGSAVFLLEENGPHGEAWLRVAHRTSDTWPSYEGLPVDRSFTGTAVRSGVARLTNDPAREPQRVRSVVEPTSLLAIPLRVKGAAIGALDLINKPGGFTEEDIRIMGLFADQAALAIENARLRRQVERLAIVEERQRLARELHDSVNQSLYSMGLFAEAAGGLIAAGNYERAMDHLNQLRETAQESLKEMRLLIFELRPPVLENEGLVAALQARLDSVEARGGLQCKLLVEGDERLPAAIEEGLYRIAMEALNNAFKHSRAQKVTVQLRFAAESTTLEVSDDGTGFEPARTRSKGGIGLSSMGERARRIGATLRIDSAPGSGTTVSVEVKPPQQLLNRRREDG